jgi:dipeptide transport system ATP-binding protein
VLSVEKLNIQFTTRRGQIHALRDVSFRISEGESVGIVGESGSGKSVTSLAIMGLLPSNAKLMSGQIQVNPQVKKAIIFQDPMTSLNPCFTIEQQLKDVIKQHQKISKSELRSRCLYYLDLVGIPDAEARLSAFPHQLSGGMSQRVMIAMAMACEPQLLIADEPTTALDVTIQAQVLSLLRKLQIEKKLSLILISHDMAVIAQNTSRILVMYAGEIVEEGLSTDLLARPAHPYTKALLSCLPSRSIELKRERLPTIRGLVPDLHKRPLGCQFFERCQDSQHECKNQINIKATPDRHVRCIL